MSIFKDILSTLRVGPLNVRGILVVTPLTEIPGIAAADALDAGDAMGTVGMNDKDVYGNPLPKRGWIVGAKLVDPDDDTLSATVHVYSGRIPGTTSDSALAHTAVDALFWITSIPFPVTTDVGAAKVAEANNVDSLYYSPTRTIWWQFSTAGTPTIAAGLMPRVQFFIVAGGE